MVLQYLLEAFWEGVLAIQQLPVHLSNGWVYNDIRSLGQNPEGQA